MTKELAGFAQTEQVDFGYTGPDWLSMHAGLFITVGALLAIAASAFLWAAFLRKRRRHPFHHLRHHAPAPPSTDNPEHRKASFFSSRKRRRRRRKRPSNPTLAETGGLPPIRTQQHPPAPT